MRRRSIKDLQAAVRQAEAELEAATKLPDVKAAAKRLQRAKEELKAAEEEAGTATTGRRAAGARARPRAS
jgi:hypothetical protein